MIGGQGTKLRMHVEGDRIVLTVEKSVVKLVKRGSEWGKEAFLDAGEALVRLSIPKPASRSRC